MPEVAAELDLHGVDAVRAFLIGQGSYGGVGTTRDTIYRFGNAAVRRGEVEDWLKWKDARESFWVRIGVIAAIAAAALAAAGWLCPLR